MFSIPKAAMGIAAAAGSCALCTKAAEKFSKYTHTPDFFHSLTSPWGAHGAQLTTSEKTSAVASQKLPGAPK